MDSANTIYSNKLIWIKWNKFSKLYKLCFADGIGVPGYIISTCDNRIWHRFRRSNSSCLSYDFLTIVGIIQVIQDSLEGTEYSTTSWLVVMCFCCQFLQEGMLSILNGSNSAVLTLNIALSIWCNNNGFPRFVDWYGIFFRIPMCNFLEFWIRCCLYWSCYSYNYFVWFT